MEEVGNDLATLNHLLSRMPLPQLQTQRTPSPITQSVPIEWLLVAVGIANTRLTHSTHACCPMQTNHNGHHAHIANNSNMFQTECVFQKYMIVVVVVVVVAIGTIMCDHVDTHIKPLRNFSCSFCP